MKKLALAILAAFALWLSTGCSHKEKASSPEADMQRSEIFNALEVEDISRMEAVADSLSLMTDDLTIDETVAVLLAYLHVHNDAATRKDRQKDLVTIRKFVDVYDIALNRHGAELEEAYNTVKNLNGNVDLPEIARSMRETLADYDASVGDDIPETVETSTKPDSAAVNTVVVANDSAVVVLPAD